MSINIFIIIFMMVELVVHLVITINYSILQIKHLLIFIVTSMLFFMCNVFKPGHLSDKQAIREQSLAVKDNNSEISEEVNDLLNEQKNYQRKCKICDIIQPLRSKHCQECQRCIRTFDHHCPWINNCVGEKNKPIFLLFIFVLECQCVVMEIDLVGRLYEMGNVQDQTGIFISSMLGICIILFGTLLLFQIWSMISNVTTWQYMRWDKITYLSGFSKPKSPFNKGIIKNLRLYWSFLGKRFIYWEKYH